MRRVDHLSREHIEGATLALLAEYQRKFPSVSLLPVPVDDIVDCHLELDFGFTDLIGEMNLPDVLGALWVNERKVLIDRSLDPTDFPAKEGRYHFTVAHECGHWILHRHYFLDDAAQPSLFGDEAEPSIVCRSSQKKAPIEWQADAFASYLLMPKEQIFAVWQEKHSSSEPYYAAEEITELTARWGLAEGSIPTVRVAKEMAQVFKVSGQAMQIRLNSLGLIQMETKPNILFAKI